MLKPGDVLEYLDENENVIGFHVEPTPEERAIIKTWLAPNLTPEVKVTPGVPNYGKV